MVRFAEWVLSQSDGEGAGITGAGAEAAVTGRSFEAAVFWELMRSPNFPATSATVAMARSPRQRIWEHLNSWEWMRLDMETERETVIGESDLKY